MPAPRSSRTRHRARPRHRPERRVRSFAVLTLIGVVLVVSLALTAFGRSSRPELMTVAAIGPLPQSTVPKPEIVARKGALRLQLPVAQPALTAIGYHAAGEGALALDPVGRQGNAGLFQRLAHKFFGTGGSGRVWYQLAGGEGAATSALDVGAAPGTTVYSPVDGAVVGITPYIVDGREFGARIDIQPQAAPAVVVSLTHVYADPSLTVGDTVVSGSSKLGKIVDLSDVERQALARYTQDAGNHVTVEVRPAAALTLS